MATIKIEKRCGGPLNWETVDGHRKLVPLGICGEKIHLEYDDAEIMESMVGRIFEKGTIHCEKCGKDGNQMLAAHAARQVRVYDAKHGYSRDKKVQPEASDEDMAF
tara:strand:- start:117 stop:434 length:318 start_codon:yes stop_codon:yes gene_type:complete